MKRTLLLKVFQQISDADGRAYLERVNSKLQEFIRKRDASTVVLLLAPKDSKATHVLMLWALCEHSRKARDGELARALAKRMLITLPYREKLTRRLFREAAEARRWEELKLALLKLFYCYCI